MFLDKNGYLRGDEEDMKEFNIIGSPKHSNLIHRNIAFIHDYNPNRDKYPKGFRQYEVHHRDRAKLNNSQENLDIVTPEQHRLIHMYKIKGKQELFDWVREIKKLQNSVNVTWSGKTKTNSVAERAIKKIGNRMMGKIELKGYKPKPSRKDMSIKREKIKLEKDSEFERLALKEFNQF